MFEDLICSMKRVISFRFSENVFHDRTKTNDNDISRQGIFVSKWSLDEKETRRTIAIIYRETDFECETPSLKPAWIEETGPASIRTTGKNAQKSRNKEK